MVADEHGVMGGASSQFSAPPFDSGACGNTDPSRNISFWGRKCQKLLSQSYWNSKCEETPAINLVLEFINMRHDRNGEPLSKKLGPVEKHPDGWWRLPIASARKSFGGQWSTAWHATTFSCLYSIMYHEELLETDYLRPMGVSCYPSTMFQRAINYVVFENVFSNGHWWGAVLELMVDRAVGKRIRTQWVQPANSIDDHYHNNWRNIRA